MTARSEELLSRGSRLHPAAWLAWLACGGAASLLTSNPLYLSLGFLAACAAYVSVRDTPKGRALTSLVLLGVGFAALSVPFNLLTGSAGSTVWTSIPEWRSPDWFGGVILGGDITAEAFVSALGRAITIATLVLLAAAFNASVDHFRLVRLAPRALSQVALVLTIAILVVPESVAQARSLQEAQRLRGRSTRGLRALPGLLLPTLQGALDRSVQRAESLDARGFGGGAPPAPLSGVAGVAGLGLVAWGAFAHFYYGPGVMPSLAMFAGVAVAVASIARGGHAGVRLRSNPWTIVDGVVACTSMLTVAILFAMRVAGVGEVTYVPFPVVMMPSFHVAGAVAFLLLLAPVFAEQQSYASAEVRA